ncbi:MAG: PKD domain-containing protein [Acidobacteria bacterium]|nr:PKD domain-containing protein [Acidobacteriota bacterium]
MTKNKLNIEELYQSQFDGYRVDPSHNVWESIQRKLFWKEFLTFRLNSFNIYYTLVAIAVPVTFAAIFLSRNPGILSGSHAETGQSGDTLQSGVPANADEKFKTLNSEATYQNLDSSTKQYSARKTGLKSKLTGSDEQMKSDRNKDLYLQEELTDIPLKENWEDEEIVSSIAFTASALSGCTPLAVSFLNESENAETWYWTFGDGGSSIEEHPSWIFDEPGEFIVRLQITGTDGIVRQDNKNITVYETPRAVFEFDEDVNLVDGQPVYFYNYSRNADYYEWNFGDNTYSYLSDPVHYYESPGSYNITLKAWNQYQCFDSVTIRDAFTDEGYSLQFPTAFAPNPAGPSGGYYTGNSTDNNEIFHPVVTGDLIEYNLKIFNRLGMLLFESNDIDIGWDGYYQQQPLPQDVYLWKARGKFSNGKTFVQAGDITLISKR